MFQRPNFELLKVTAGESRAGFSRASSPPLLLVTPDALEKLINAYLLIEPRLWPCLLNVQPSSSQSVSPGFGHFHLAGAAKGDAAS